MAIYRVINVFLYSKFIASIYLLFFIQQGLSQKKEAPNYFQNAIDNIISDKHLKSANFSIAIQNLATGKVEASYNEHKALTPASVQKIFTTAAFLDLAGKDFRYQTLFYLKGIKMNDTLYMGDLFVNPTADPSFCSPYQLGAMNIDVLSDTLAEILKTKNIKSIFGNIKVNRNFIIDNPENTEWLYYDLGNYYGAGIHSLNIFENTAWLTFKPADSVPAICPILKVIPNELSKQFESEVQSVDHTVINDLYVLGSSESCLNKVQGEIQCCAGDTIGIKAAIKDPESLFEIILKQKLMDRGIWINSQSNDIAAFEDELIFEYLSPSLENLAERALKKSVNLYCESFLHSYGWLNNGSTNRSSSVRKLTAFWKSKLEEEQGFFLVDGSGLSPKNMISANQLTNALLWINENKKINQFYKLLSNPDEEGMLVGALQKLKHKKNKLRLKSGSMEHVRSFAGYILEDGKPKFAVAIIINQYDCSGEIIKSKLAKFFAELVK